MAKVTDQMCVEIINNTSTVDEVSKMAGVTRQAVHNRVKFYKSKNQPDQAK
jgi:hypothetical protein